MDDRAAYMKDKWFYRGVVAILGLLLLGSFATITYLLVKQPGAEIPNSVVALGSGALGALAGLFK